MVENYKKTYAEFGIDVFIGVGDMGVYAGDYSENIHLKTIYFVKANSVKTGSYVYDTYKNDEDERLFKLKDLPALVYSETMYDIAVLLKK